MKYTYEGQMPLISNLTSACKNYLNINSSEDVSIAKHIPHNFEWKWMNPDEECVEKRKKNKEFKFKAGEGDLRKFPFFLKDGDVIGLRVEKENSDKLDDF